MKINKTLTYALTVVGYIADNYKDGLVKTDKVSKECNISKEYLKKVLQMLVRTNILISKRGPKGGFLLTRDPEEITMLQIIEAIDGPMMMPPIIAEHTKNENFTLNLEEISKKATEKEMQIYDKAKLSDMLK